MAEDKFRVLSPERKRKLQEMLDDPEFMKAVREHMPNLNSWGRKEDAQKTLGTCPHCQGEIMEETKIPYTDNPRIGGPPPPRIHDSYHCKKCGTMFAFVPKNQVADEESS